MAIITPPRLPPITKLGYGGKKNEAYLIYKGRVPYTTRVNDKTTLVVFNKPDYANFVRVFLESHFLQHKSWPNILNHENVSFVHDRVQDFGLLDVEYINPYSIFDMCLRLNVHACVVDNITEKNDRITIHCDFIEVEPRPDTYRYVLENIYDDDDEEGT